MGPPNQTPLCADGVYAFVAHNLPQYYVAFLARDEPVINMLTLSFLAYYREVNNLGSSGYQLLHLVKFME